MRILLLTSILVACSQTPSSHVEFSGARHKEVRLPLQAHVVSQSDNRRNIQNQLDDWIYYVQGAIANGSNNSILIKTASPSIVSITPRDNVFDVEVSYELTAAFQDLAPIELLLPIGISPSDLNAFKEKYPSCSYEPADIYWYGYHPNGCVDPADTAFVTHVTVTPELTAGNTVDKSPEYARLWQDDLLEVTHVGGNEEEVGASHLLANMTQHFGEPTPVSTETFEGGTETTTQYQVGTRRILLHYFALNGHVRQSNRAFVDLFQAATAQSDLISYNGHAGLGANVRYFLNQVRFTAGRYHVLWVNACQPYAYLSDDAFTQMQRLNPSDPWSKNLDLMLSVRIGSFSFGDDITGIIQGFVDQAPYAQILSPLPGDAAVLGEEDNI